MGDLINIDARLIEMRCTYPPQRDAVEKIHAGFSCRRCKAQPGDPCRRPNGNACMPHAPRTDKYLTAWRREQVRKANATSEDG